MIRKLWSDSPKLIYSTGIKYLDDKQGWIVMKEGCTDITRFTRAENHRMWRLRWETTKFKLAQGVNVHAVVEADFMRNLCWNRSSNLELVESM